MKNRNNRDPCPSLHLVPSNTTLIDSVPNILQGNKTSCVVFSCSSLPRACCLVGNTKQSNKCIHCLIIRLEYYKEPLFLQCPYPQS